MKKDYQCSASIHSSPESPTKCSMNNMQQHHAQVDEQPPGRRNTF